VTDLDTKGPTSLKLPLPEVPAKPVVEEPLWLIRLRLARRAFGRNWKLFTRNKIGVVGLVIIGIFAVMALIHPILMSRVWDPAIYDPFNGYDAPRTVLTVVEKCDIPEEAVSATCPPGEIDLASARLKTHPFVKVGEVIEIPQQPAAPSKAHWLGTDPLGRDILSQLMYSTRAAFALGAIAALVTVFIATSIGSIAAFYGGWLDSVLMRFADLVLLVPLIDRMVKVSLRTIAMDVPPQDVITRDNVSIKVNAVIFFRVVEPERAIVSVEDYLYATSQIAQTTLRSVLGQVELDDLLSARDKINQQLQRIIDEHTDPWGIKVTTVEVKHIDLPQDMQRAMSKQAEAERERRAKVINADGEFQAAAKLAEAARVLAEAPIAVQLRYLQTMREIASERNTTTFFPLPMDLFAPLLEAFKKGGGGG